MRNRNNYNRELITDESSFQLKNLIIVIIIILAIFIAFYFITKYVLINKKDNNPVQESVIQNEKIIFEKLKEISKSGKCVIVVSHSENIKKYADEIYYIENKSIKRGNL